MCIGELQRVLGFPAGRFCALQVPCSTSTSLRFDSNMALTRCHPARFSSMLSRYRQIACSYSPRWDATAPRLPTGRHNLLDPSSPQLQTLLQMTRGSPQIARVWPVPRHGRGPWPGAVADRRVAGVLVRPLATVRQIALNGPESPEVVDELKRCIHLESLHRPLSAGRLLCSLCN
jgi:hypothetical protein